MKKFESPQINVVKFVNEDVITTSNQGGYGGNVTEGDIDSMNIFSTQAASDQGTGFPF